MINFMKLKSLCKAMNTLKKKGNGILRNRKNIFMNSTSDRELTSKIYEELKELDINKLNNTIKCCGNSPDAICILMLIPLSQEGLHRTRSEICT